MSFLLCQNSQNMSFLLLPKLPKYVVFQVKQKGPKRAQFEFSFEPKMTNFNNSKRRRRRRTTRTTTRFHDLNGPLPSQEKSGSPSLALQHLLTFPLPPPPPPPPPRESKKKWRKKSRHFSYYGWGPANNSLLINFRLSSDAEILLTNTDRACELSPKRAKTCTQRVRIPTELPFCMPPLVVG